VDLAYQTPAEEIAALRCELATARAQLGTAAVEIEHLRMQLAALRRQQYGQSSERLDAEIVQLELRLEDLEESEAERQAAIPDPALPHAPANFPTKSRAKAVRKPLPDHLPRETVVHEPELVCGCCDRSKLACLGEDTTEVLEKIPARLKVIRHVRPRGACPCEGGGLPGLRAGVPGARPRPAYRARPPGTGADRPRGRLEILRRPAAVPPVGDLGS
jgi:hypothetical protein